MQLLGMNQRAQTGSRSNFLHWLLFFSTALERVAEKLFNNFLATHLNLSVEFFIGSLIWIRFLTSENLPCH
jgi:hypothetical protein